MEGALPSVVGGLVELPVIAVPTSIGYGAHFGGLAPLLAMLNSCATGIAVVNIDNGFGAGYFAHLINQAAVGSRQTVDRQGLDSGAAPGFTGGSPSFGGPDSGTGSSPAAGHPANEFTAATAQRHPPGTEVAQSAKADFAP